MTPQFFAYTRKDGITPVTATPSGVGETLGEVYQWMQSLDYIKEAGSRYTEEGLECRIECFWAVATALRAIRTKLRTINAMLLIYPITCPHSDQSEHQKTCPRCSLVAICVNKMSDYKHLVDNMDPLHALLQQFEDLLAPQKRPPAQQRRPRARARA